MFCDQEEVVIACWEDNV